MAAIGELHFTGNLIPPAWYHHLKLPSGRTDLVGCTLLGEIVYQYRPLAVVDEASGEVHHVKRFTRDQFCAPLAYFEKKFDLTTDQVRQGLKRLEQAGLIVREYRTITVAGREVHGMAFIAPVPAALQAITTPAPADAGRPEARPAAIRPMRRPVASPERPVPTPEGAVSTPGGAVQKPPYKDSLPETPQDPQPTPPTSRNAAEIATAKWSGRSALENRNPIAAAGLRESTLNPAPTAPAPFSEAPSDPAPDVPLLFDFHLTRLGESEKAELRRRLARLPPPLAQLVLDEYNSAVGRGMLFHNRWGWLEYLIRKAQRGEFIPTSELAARRRAPADPPPAVPAVAAPPPPVPSALWEERGAALQGLLADGEFATYVLPLRGVEDGATLWLEAPNRYTVDWVTARWPLFEQVLAPHTALALGVRLESG
ncbi:MAG: hypothetical protein EA420_10810 [Candidatus Competibacteraceae bacterium]|nr:MAG: hypothetical protein EA420_10810 [Candidatus Competibacteraceae bacterium]